MKNFYCKDIENELKSYHIVTDWANFVLMQDSWLQLKLDSIAWRHTLKNSHNSQMQWLVVSTLCQETNIHLIRSVGSEEAPNLGPYWKSRPVIYTANMELRSEFGLWTRQYSLLGQNFSWTKQVDDDFEQWNINSRRSAPSICFKTGCERFCMPIKGKFKITKKRICWLFTTNRSHWKKELDRYWIIFLWKWGIEESNVSSSSFTTNASRRRRSDSFLEN